MKIPSNVKIKRGLLRLFPFSKYTAQAIYPNIYLSKCVYDNIVSDKPKVNYIAVLLHEQKHIERQSEVGWFRWGIKYLVFRNFRFNEELRAIRASMKYLKKNNVEFDIPKRARYLSSWLYFWCISYDRAVWELEKVWNDV